MELFYDTSSCWCIFVVSPPSDAVPALLLLLLFNLLLLCAERFIARALGSCASGRVPSRPSLCRWLV